MTIFEKAEEIRSKYGRAAGDLLESIAYTQLLLPEVNLKTLGYPDFHDIQAPTKLSPSVSSVQIPLQHSHVPFTEALIKYLIACHKFNINVIYKNIDYVIEQLKHRHTTTISNHPHKRRPFIGQAMQVLDISILEFILYSRKLLGKIAEGGITSQLQLAHSVDVDPYLLTLNAITANIMA